MAHTRVTGISDEDPVPGGDAAPPAKRPRPKTKPVQRPRPPKPAAPDALAHSAAQAATTEREARHARVREGAAAVVPTERWSRIRFLYALGEDYERGVTPALCAEVWGLSVSAVEADASIAGGLVQLTADPEFDKRVWHRETYESYERARKHSDYIYELLTKAGMPLIEDGPHAGSVDWKGIVAHADALSKCHDQISKVQEQLGKACGAIARGPLVQVTLTPEDIVARRGEVATAVAEAQEAAREEMIQALGAEGVDRLTVARVARRLAAGGAGQEEVAGVVVTSGGRR